MDEEKPEVFLSLVMAFFFQLKPLLGARSNLSEGKILARGRGPPRKNHLAKKLASVLLTLIGV